MKEINFYKLSENYEKNLNIHLRDFGSDNEFLKFWVPDTNLKKSFCNLIDALKEVNLNNFRIVLRSNKDNLIDEIFINNIKKKIGDIKVEKKGEDLYLDISINQRIYDNNFDSFFPKKIIKKSLKQNQHSKSKFKYNKEDINKNYLKKIEELKKLKINHCYLDAKNEKELKELSKNKSNLLFSEKNGIFEIKLIINKSSNIVVKSYHNIKEKNNNSVLVDFFCNHIKDLHIQEVSDHSVIYLEHYFRSKNENIVRGIFLPNNAGTFFENINIIIRKIMLLFRKVNNYNDTLNKFYPKIGKYWYNLSEEKKSSIIRKKIKDYCKNNDINENDLKFIGIDKVIRIYVEIGNIVNLNKKHLFILEDIFKQIDQRLEIFTTEIKDSNKLRWRNAPKSDIMRISD